MNLQDISGQRQLAFMQQFDYIREAGTPAEHKAAEAITKELASFGVTGVLEPFTIDTYAVDKVTFTVTEPYEKTYTVAAYGRCGSTPPEGVEAPFLYAENGDDISLAYAAGKIVMVNGPMRPDLYQKVVTAGAVGFLTIGGTPIDTGADRTPEGRALPRLKDTPIQGAVLHHLDAIEIVERGASRARLVVRQHETQATSHNVIATIAGSDLADQVLTLTAHYDSVPAGKGAYDNMAGAAIIMELCRYFAAHPPRRTLQFIWFGAEEKGLLGSRHFVTKHEEELSRHQFNMNVDLAGQLVGGTVVGVTGDIAICHVIEYMAREIGLGLSTKHMVWSSDSNCFAWKGVPAMTLNRDGFGMHTRHDTLDLISPWSLQRSAQILGYIADRIANITAMPFPRTIPQEFAETLSRQFNR